MAKPVVDKSVFEQHLQAARRRLELNATVLRHTQDLHDHSLERGMVQTAAMLKPTLERQRRAVNMTQAVIDELEKATGALPLK